MDGRTDTNIETKKTEVLPYNSYSTATTATACCGYSCYCYTAAATVAASTTITGTSAFPSAATGRTQEDDVDRYRPFNLC